MKRWFVGLVILGMLAFVSCKRESHRAHGINEMEYSELIALYDRGDYDEVFIVNHEGNEVAHYILVSAGDSVPRDLPDDATVIQVPIQSLIVDSEVYASAIEEMGTEEIIKGMFDTQYVTSPSLRNRIENHKIANVGVPASPSLERIMEIHPDGIMVSYYDGMQMTGIDKTNYPVIKMYDLQETSPLGRAEWIRFVGRLIGKEEEADSIFRSVSVRYKDIKNRLQSEDFKPKVLVETPYEGIWYVSGGKSYQAAMIKDAGGKYFKDEDGSAGSLNLSVEQILESGSDADVWLIKVFGKDLNKKSLLEENQIYRELKPYKTREIYYSDTSKSGLYREFPFHPDLLLDDYHIIFSKGDTSKLRYFKKIED